MKRIFIDIFKRRDITSICVLIIPILLMLVVKYSVSLEGWYRTFDALTGLIVSISVSFVLSLYIIDHRQTKKNMSYLLKVLGVGMIITFVYVMFFLSLFKVSDATFINILMIGLLNAIYVLPITLMTVAFANDRKTAVKIISLTTLYILVLALPYVTLGLRQFYLSFIPSFWLGKYACNFISIYVFWGIGMSIVWSVVFAMKYKYSK